MFNASYPATFLPEANGKGLHVRFPDLPEALTSGDDLEDTLAQAADCLAEAIAGRIARGDAIPAPSKAKRGQHLIGVPLYLAPKCVSTATLRRAKLSYATMSTRRSDFRTLRNAHTHPGQEPDADAGAKGQPFRRESFQHPDRITRNGRRPVRALALRR
jgi:antitoxin HicB